MDTRFGSETTSLFDSKSRIAARRDWPAPVRGQLRNGTDVVFAVWGEDDEGLIWGAYEDGFAFGPMAARCLDAYLREPEVRRRATPVITGIQGRALSAIKRGARTQAEVAKQLGATVAETRVALNSLLFAGAIRPGARGYALTPAGGAAHG